MGFFKDCGCGCGGAKAQQKFLISVMSALVFFIISNPDTYRLTRSIFGRWVAGPTGCPSVRGLMLHTVVFVLITWGMMNIKKEGIVKKGCGCGDNKPIKKGEKVVIEPPVPMVEAPDPKPGFTESQIEIVESGRNLTPMSIDSAGTLFG